jgi:hypothetical protein
MLTHPVLGGRGGAEALVAGIMFFIIKTHEERVVWGGGRLQFYIYEG